MKTNYNRVFLALGGMTMCWLFSSAALACSSPSEKWYHDVSDVIFDGSASCNSKNRVCRVRVKRVIKNPQNLVLKHRTIEVNYQNWYADNFNQDYIIITCGVPFFEPEQKHFQARFYANLDEKTSELIVRRHRVRGTELSRQEDN